MKKLLYLLLATVLFSFAACSDDDDYITIHPIYDMSTGNEPPESVVNITILRGGSYFIKGGYGPYTVTASDAELINASVENDRLTIYGLKLGKGELTITDHNGLVQKLPVVVSEHGDLLRVQLLQAVVAGEISKETLAYIQQDVLKNSLVKQKGRYRLTYLTKETGTVDVYPTETDENMQTGTFRLSIAEKLFSIQLGEKTVNYTIVLPTGRDLGPIRLDLLEDLTKEYETEYPNVHVSRRQTVEGSFR